VKPETTGGQNIRPEHSIIIKLFPRSSKNMGREEPG